MSLKKKKSREMKIGYLAAILNGTPHALTKVWVPYVVKCSKLFHVHCKMSLLTHNRQPEMAQIVCYSICIFFQKQILNLR